MHHNQPNVALAHDHLFQIGGAEQVVKKLSEIYSDAPLYTLICTDSARAYLNHRKIVPSYLQNVPGGKKLFKLFIRWMPAAWEYFDFSAYDVVISSASAFAKNIITSPQTTHVCYCHSPTRYLWSDRRDYLESLHIPRALKLYLQAILTDLRILDLEAARRVNYFIANSQFIAHRIKHFYQRDSTIIYPPVNTHSFAISPSIDDYYLVVSRLRPYKRVDLVIEAFNRLKLPLVVVGGGEEYQKLRSLAKHNITFLGETDDATRNRYLSRCKAFINPQEEDFGISAVEAMASGRPVIAYAAGGALETIMHNVTGVFFEEQSWESLAYAVLASRLIEFDAAVIKKHAEQFSSEVFSQKIIKFINDVAP